MRVFCVDNNSKIKKIKKIFNRTVTFLTSFMYNFAKPNLNNCSYETKSNISSKNQCVLKSI